MGPGGQPEDVFEDILEALLERLVATQMPKDAPTGNLQLGFGWALCYFFDFVGGTDTLFSDFNNVEIDSVSSTEGGIFLTILVESGIKVWKIIFLKFFLFWSCPCPHCSPRLKMPTIRSGGEQKP